MDSTHTHTHTHTSTIFSQQRLNTTSSIIMAATSPRGVRGFTLSGVYNCNSTAIRSLHSIHNVVDRGDLQAMWEELAGKVGRRDLWLK